LPLGPQRLSRKRIARLCHRERQMSRKPQTLYQKDEEKCCCDFLRSVNLKSQLAGFHLGSFNLSRTQ
jgi:hypothetical protein